MDQKTLHELHERMTLIARQTYARDAYRTAQRYAELANDGRDLRCHYGHPGCSATHLGTCSDAILTYAEDAMHRAGLADEIECGACLDELVCDRHARD